MAKITITCEDLILSDVAEESQDILERMEKHPTSEYLAKLFHRFFEMECEAAANGCQNLVRLTAESMVSEQMSWEPQCEAQSAAVPPPASEEDQWLNRQEYGVRVEAAVLRFEAAIAQARDRLSRV